MNSARAFQHRDRKGFSFSSMWWLVTKALYRRTVKSWLKNLNTFLNYCFGSSWWLKSSMAVGAIVCSAVSASSLDPNRKVSQYTHEYWGIEKGFTGGAISVIGQSSDGYLWIGTDKGLFRFDGLNFRQVAQANPSSLGIGPVQTLLADRSGNLWILLRSTQLLRYRDGKFELSRGAAENGVTAIA